MFISILIFPPVGVQGGLSSMHCFQVVIIYVKIAVYIWFWVRQSRVLSLFPVLNKFEFNVMLGVMFLSSKRRVVRSTL